jgi:putative transposase
MALLQTEFFRLAEEKGVGLEAWALFPNHYHFVARVNEGFDAKDYFKRLHGRTAVALNRLDGVSGRQVWYRYRDTNLTNVNSYLARLHYTHTNPVRHGVAPDARMYPYGSAHWFETQADEAFVRTVYSFPIDRLVIEDDY